MRTHVNWDKHELKIIETPEVKIWTLKLPDRARLHSVNFINTCGVMTVTGDYSNWVFCREFHPSSDGRVDDYYWIEKLQISSTQNGLEFDSEGTEKRIQELLEEGVTDREREYLEGCLNTLEDGGWYYEQYAYSENCGKFEDYECVPFEKRVVFHLKVVFDAFDEICKRYKIQK